MARYLLFVFFVLVSSRTAFADPILVRSGEHESFVRLALDIDEGADWALNSEGYQFSIQLSNHADGFDSSKIFDRIDRRIISSVDSIENELSVYLTCECTVEAYQLGAEMVVVDIFPAENRQSEDATSTIMQETDSQPNNPSASQSFLYNQRRFFALQNQLPESQQPNGVNGDGYQGDSLLSEKNEAEESLDPSAFELLQAQREIIQGLGKAMTRGVLKPGPVPTSVRELGLATDQAAGVSGEIGTNQALRADPKNGLGPNIRVLDDRGEVGTNHDQLSHAELDRHQCIDASRLDMRSWSDDRPFLGQVSELRATLFDERDQLNDVAALQLARIYLFFGFGVEARQILSIGQNTRSEFPELWDIAAIMEYGKPKQNGYLARYLHCEGEAALWAVLAAPHLSQADPVNVDAALLSLSGLPLRLRQILAPEVSARLLSYGDREAAATALRTLERTPERTSSNAEFAQAELELASGDIQAAQEGFLEVVSTNAEQSAEALIAVVNSAIETGAVIDEDLVALVESYAKELRNDPIGDELNQAHILSLAKSGQFVAAFEQFDSFRAPNVRLNELASSLHVLLAQDASDTEFLHTVFEGHADMLEMIDDLAKTHVAHRLLDLGFAASAEILLSNVSDSRTDENTQILRARVAIELGRPEEARANLFGVSSKEADQIRAQAEMMKGNVRQAYELFQRAGDNDRMRQTAWMAEDWNELVVGVDDQFETVAELSKVSAPELGQLEGIIGRLEDSISESANARQVLQTFLEQMSTSN